jgi:hypothetical protein
MSSHSRDAYRIILTEDKQINNWIKLTGALFSRKQGCHSLQKNKKKCFPSSRR